MSSIVKLTIKGVRSFSHEEEQTLKFLRPLTVITGHNGAGKTTIIECLRYACSGFLPPGAQNSCFVHDLKKAGRSEVEGFVNLVFRDKVSRKITVRRRFKALEKKRKKVEFQSLPPIIWKTDGGGTKKKLSRCQKLKDLNEEMVDGLGVSQTIMVNVIFCHQVESNWPLSEGNQLKSKFDEIFGATRYIKALDSIKKLRKEQANRISELKIHVENHKEWMKEAKQETETLEIKQSELAEAQRIVSECIFELEPKEKMLQEMLDKDSHFQKLQITIGQLKVRIKELQSSCKEIQDVCNSGNVNTLAKEIEEKRNSKTKKVEEYNDMLKELVKLKKDEKALEIEKGKLEQDQQQLEGLQQKVHECVSTLSSVMPGCQFKLDWNATRTLVDALMEEKRQKDLQLDKLSKEISKLSQNQQAKVEIWEEEIKTLQEYIRNIRNSFDSEVRELLKTCTADNLYGKLCDFYRDQKLKLEQAQEKLQAVKLEQCREDCTRVRIIEQIEKKERKIEELEQLLKRNCAESKVEQFFGQMPQNDINRGQQRSYVAHAGTSQSSMGLTIGPGTDVNRCPFCNRDFTGSEDEVQNFKLKISTLSSKVMCLKMNLKSVEENLRKHNATIQMKEKNIETLKEKESMAVKLMPNICILDYYLKVISKREADIAGVQESTSDHNGNSLKTMINQKEKLQMQISILSDGLQKLVFYFGDMRRFSSLPEKLQTNSSRLQVVTDSISQEENKARTLKLEIEYLREDIKKKTDQEKTLNYYNSQLKKKLADIKTVEQELDTTEEQLRKAKDSLASKQTKEQMEREISDLLLKKSAEDGRLGVLEEVVEQLEDKLNEDRYRNVDENYRACVVDLKTTETANKDLEKYYNALDWAVIEFHKIKMEEINRIIYEYWTKIYKGNVTSYRKIGMWVLHVDGKNPMGFGGDQSNLKDYRDIDFIKVRSEASSSETTARRSYNYRVVMVIDGAEMDMRGRCSAGQKVLASLIIRLALAETFCLSCGVLALDEPTANLDYENKQGLASALTEIIENKMKKYKQNNFQLIIITHDEAFVEMLEGSGYADHFYRVTKDDDGNSIINRKNISELQS